MKIHLLNHASIIIESEDVILLFDPWFFGTAFSGGWGLRYDNPLCLEHAKRCTHLWISHFHQDHFHVPTLKKLLEINPEIIVIGNHSFNFQLDVALGNIGFKNIISFKERTKLKLSDNFEITRYPTTGIDNMLYLSIKGIGILNYNDCNLPIKAAKKIKNKIGKIDILFNNYNIATKVLEYPLSSPEEIKSGLIKNFVESSKIFNPKFIIAFASDHYFRASESLELNNTLLSNEDIIKVDNCVIPISLGEKIEFNELDCTYTKIDTSDPISVNYTDLIQERNSIEFGEIKKMSRVYASRMKKAFLYITFWIPKLNIKISDLNIICSFSFQNGLEEIDSSSQPHITTKSEALYFWFKNLYGTDSFWVGAHFEINSTNFIPLQWQLLIGLLTENRLDIKSLIKMCFTSKGITFLINRREEITALILGMKFKVGSRK
jgi:hypothetical protein